MLLAKNGWWGNSPTAILNAPVDDVINAYHYEIFCREFEVTDFEINKGTK